MNQLDLMRETIALYHKYEWRVQRALLTTETGAALAAHPLEALAGVALAEHEADALWFARPSHEGREAWELRLVSGTPYALFEAFEADEPEIDREEVRADAEARLREYARNIGKTGQYPGR